MFERWTHRLAAAVLVLAAPLAPALAVPDGVNWDSAHWNPVPIDDGNDLVLPMPCGGAMTFRRVVTPALSDVWLDDRPFDLGTAADDELAYSEYLRTEYIAGSIIDGGQRVFYMGKYEVTADQFAAVTGEACPEPSVAGRLPAAGLTWFEAVDFTRRYNEWLLQNAADALPREEDEPAFLRLPTEVEWEFVTRGGVMVGDQAFDDRLFPMDGPLSNYAWYQGPDSAAGRFKPIGLLQPNPLGLFDLLGNVEEFVIEPFRMNRAGRFHGQRGGFFTKGGSIRTTDTRMRTAMRIEYNYFDETTGSATRLDSFGMRLLMSAPVGTSIARLEAIRESWEQVPRLRLDTAGLNPIEALDALSDNLEDALVRESLEEIEARLAEEMADTEALAAAAEAQLREIEQRLLATREAVGEVEAALRRELAARNEAESEALQALIYSGAFIMRKLRDDNGRLAGMQSSLARLDSLLTRFPDDPVLVDQRDDLAPIVEARARVFAITENAYYYVLRLTGRNYSEDDLAREVTLVAQTLDALYDQPADRSDGTGGTTPPGLRLGAFARLFADQAARYGAGGGLDQAALLDEILDL